MLIGYCRVSKADGSQDTALQRDALSQAGVADDRIYEDEASGAKADRPGLDACLKAVRPGDTLVVWKLDRLGRSLRQLVQTVDQLHNGEAHLRILTGPLAADTSDPAGRFVFHVFAALAEYERELIRERTRAGIAAARARGKKAGRRWTPMSKILEAAELMKDPDASPSAVARSVGISRATLYRNMTPDGELKPEARQRLKRESDSRAGRRAG